MQIYFLNLVVFFERLNKIMSFVCRSLPKFSAQQDEDGGHSHGHGGQVQLFEPIPHDHSFCERVVINASIPVFFYYNSFRYINKRVTD